MSKGQVVLKKLIEMDRWKNKVAVVTGASSGIGAATARDLVKSGMIVAGLARREEKVCEIRDSLPKELQSRLHPIKCDVTKEEDVKNAFAWIEKNLGGPDVLVNNAGIVRMTELIKPNNTKEIKDVLDTNVMGVVFCTREAFNSMKARKVDGHIIIINSIAGHRTPNLGNDFPSFNIYPASKYAITSMTETYRQEFQRAGTKVKISSISPGLVLTDIFPVEIENIKTMFPMLKPEDISDAILYMLGTPPHVQIHELTIKPVGEIY